MKLGFMETTSGKKALFNEAEASVKIPRGGNAVFALHGVSGQEFSSSTHVFIPFGFIYSYLAAPAN